MKYLFLFTLSVIWIKDACYSQYSSTISLNSYLIEKRKKPKNSMAKGTGFVYWGYNRSAYTRSTIHFEGAGYDFSLKGVKAKDRPSTTIGEYFNPAKITVPQFNIRAGYNFKNYWNISLGYDHFKYVMVHGPEYLLNGKINEGVDPNWSGNYDDELVITNEKDFHYENSNGMNYIRLELSNVKNLVRNGRDNFTLSYLLGLSSGAILSINDFNFGNQKDMATMSLSGLGVSGHAGVRFEFFKHIFLQTNVGVGFLRQMNVHTRPNDYNSFARQSIGYIEGNIVLGALFYIRPTNSCDSCPVWH
ncbi:MAG: hypothetical protein ACKO6A_01270 [Bacteroidota bacterium]